MALTDSIAAYGEWWVYIDPFGMEREIMEVEELE